MKIEDAIEALQEEKRNGTKNVIMAYWTAEDFNRKDNSSWQEELDIVDSDYDWSESHNEIGTLLDSLND